MHKYLNDNYEDEGMKGGRKSLKILTFYQRFILQSHNFIEFFPQGFWKELCNEALTAVKQNQSY